MSDIEWQPIETAPKDGRVLLLGYRLPNSKLWRTLRGGWISQDEIDEWENCDDCEAGWYEQSVEADEENSCWPTRPTHWMPLPKPPREGHEPSLVERLRAASEKINALAEEHGWNVCDEAAEYILAAASQACPQCHSLSGLKQPATGKQYCEDCGWPDEDFAAPKPDDELAWHPIETAPKDGSIFTGRIIDTRPYRWKAYKPQAARQMRKAGRWQRMNDYGGWDNCELPQDWQSLPKTTGAKP